MHQDDRIMKKFLNKLINKCKYREGWKIWLKPKSEYQIFYLKFYQFGGT